MELLKAFFLMLVALPAAVMLLWWITFVALDSLNLVGSMPLWQW